MRNIIEENELENVVGGTVYLSKEKMKVGFEVTGEIFELQNCTYLEALGLIDSLHTQYLNSGQSGEAYELAVKEAMMANGWI